MASGYDSFDTVRPPDAETMGAGVRACPSLAEALDTIDALVVVLDHTGTVVHFNRSCEAVTGYDRRELLGRPVWERLLVEPERPTVQRVFRTLSPRRFPNRHRHHWYTREGERRLIDWSSAALFDTTGNVTHVIATGVDVTELHHSRRRLEMYDLIVSAAGEHLSFVDHDYVYRAVNATYLRSHGRSYEEIVDHSVSELLGASAFEQVKPRLDRCLGGETVAYQAWFDFPGGRRRLMDVTYSPARGGGGEVIGVVVNSRDITEQIAASTELRLAARVFQCAGEAILITDDRGIIRDVNPAYCQISGYSREEVIGKTPAIGKSNRHPPEFYRQMWEALTTTGNWEGEIWDRRKNGEVYPKRLTITAIADERGAVTHYVGLFSDITEKKAEHEQLHRMAHHCPLTGLPNRTLFFDRLDHILSLRRRDGGQAAVMFIDLDYFKEINDRYGHDVGDRLLRGVAERLSGCIRDSDTVARLGGDEFTAILADVAHPSAAETVATKMLAQFATPFDLEERGLNVTCSIGIALFPHHGETAETLLKHADKAAYSAKEQGRNAYHLAELPE